MSEAPNTQPCELVDAPPPGPKRRWRCTEPADPGSAPDDPDTRLEVLRITSEHFRQDISSFWGHATFYVVLQGALGTVFATVVGPRDRDSVAGLLAPTVLALLLSLAGLLFSVAWFLTGIGRRILIGAWRDQVLHQEALVLQRHRSYEAVEALAERMSLEPTRITMVVPLVLAVAWVAAIVWSSLLVW